MQMTTQKRLKIICNVLKEKKKKEKEGRKEKKKRRQAGTWES